MIGPSLHPLPNPLEVPMWRTTAVLALPFAFATQPAFAEPIMLAKLVVPSPKKASRPPALRRAPSRPLTVIPAQGPATNLRVRMYAHRVLSSEAGPVVLLRDEAQTQTMPIWIGLAEAKAIQRALERYPVSRPLSHDLMVSFLRELHAEVVDVEVNALRGDTFIGVAHLRTVHGKLLSVDARPSDLIALALRTGAPIFVQQDVLQASKLEPHARISPRRAP